MVRDERLGINELLRPDIKYCSRVVICNAVAVAMRDGYRDILAKGSNPYSVEEAPEGDVRGVSGFIVLLHRYP